MMNKDVIYIDTEDDITAIIGKVKSAEAKIIALVPPKRIGVLQSVVNLKLLQRAAQAVDKRVVVITSDSSLTALAAGVKIPVAKNLQSRPEVPQIAALKVNDEDVINGQELPVGDIATSLGAKKTSAADEISDKISITPSTTATDTAKKPAGSPSAKKVMPFMGFAKKDGSKGQKGFSIPNFDDFRKRIFLFGGLGAIALVFLIWAIFFAPRAEITITARTTAVNIDKALTLKPSLQQSDPAKLELKPNVQQVKKSVATEFDATGSKDIGNKASGTIRVKNCDSPASFTVDSGTTFTSSGGLKFTATKDVVVSGLTGSSSACRNTGAGAGTGDVPVSAADIGTEYNIPPGSFSMAGISGDVYANSTAAMSGGTKEKVTVVSQEDVDKAKQQLASQNTNEVKAELKKQFKAEEFLIIEESYIAEPANPSTSPAVGEQASRAKLTQETTYTLVGVSRSDLKTILTSVVDEALKSKPDQQQYALGDKNIAFQLFQKIDGGNFTTNIATTAFIGPKIDTKSLAKQLTGKRFGEIQAIAQEIDGVNKVDIKFSPFWVTTAPTPDKIEIKFSVANDK